MTGPEAVRARMLAEVAEQLDAANIVTLSMMVTGEDMIVVSIPNLADYHRAMRLFDSGHGRTSWRGIVVRIHMGRRVRALTVAHRG